MKIDKALAEKLLWSFARAFAATAVVLIPGVLNAPNFSAGKALGIALVVASVTAGFRAVQHVLVD